MLGKLVLIFILVPMADLILLLMIARIHWLISVLSIIVSGVVGAWLVRRQGTAVGKNIRRNFVSGQIPTEQLMEGGMILLAAGLLLTPGLLTDLFGISILIPVCRRFYRSKLAAWFKKRVEIRTYQFKQAMDPNTVDGSFEVQDHPDQASSSTVDTITHENGQN